MQDEFANAYVTIFLRNRVKHHFLRKYFLAFIVKERLFYKT